jgi:hypothetical protein
MLIDAIDQRAIQVEQESRLTLEGCSVYLILRHKALDDLIQR